MPERYTGIPIPSMAATSSSMRAGWSVVCDPSTISGRCALASRSAAFFRSRSRAVARGAGPGRVEAGVGRSAVDVAQVAADVGGHGALGQRRVGLVGLVAGPVADHRLVVEQIDGQLDEHGARDAVDRLEERALHRRDHVLEAIGAREPLDVGLHQRDLVDVLQRSTAAQQRGGGAADQHEGGLRELRVLDGGDGVGHARARRDRRDAGDAREARHRVRREHGVHLVPHVRSPGSPCAWRR